MKTLISLIIGWTLWVGGLDGTWSIAGQYGTWKDCDQAGQQQRITIHGSMLFSGLIYSSRAPYTCQRSREEHGPSLVREAPAQTRERESNNAMQLVSPRTRYAHWIESFDVIDRDGKPVIRVYARNWSHSFQTIGDCETARYAVNRLADARSLDVCKAIQAEEHININVQNQVQGRSR